MSGNLETIWNNRKIQSYLKMVVRGTHNTNQWISITESNISKIKFKTTNLRVFFSWSWLCLPINNSLQSLSTLSSESNFPYSYPTMLYKSMIAQQYETEESIVYTMTIAIITTRMNTQESYKTKATLASKFSLISKQNRLKR